MKNNNFEFAAKTFIEDLYDKLELQDESYELDIEYSNEVLTIDAFGKIFVVNKQAPAKQIWLASPISGPYHFSQEGGEWVDSKNNNLNSILSNEISEILNKKIVLK
jgi:iron donor protein CyaY